MMVHQLRSNKTIVIDFQEKSPERLPIQKFQDNPKIALWGKRSVGVPGLVAGFALGLLLRDIIAGVLRAGVAVSRSRSRSPGPWYRIRPS